MNFIKLSELNKKLSFNHVGIIPYIVEKREDKEFAYALMAVASGIPTLIDIGDKIEKDQKIEDVVSNTVYNKTYKSLYIPPEEIYRNGWILYRSNRIVYSKDKEVEEYIEDVQDNLTGIVFMCVDVNLKNLCVKFREKFIIAHKKQLKTEITHLLWLPQTKFIYIIRNTTYIDNNGERKENPSGNVPLDNLLSSIYSIKDDEIPIELFYNKDAHVPVSFSKYPEMEPFLRNFLADAYAEGVDFFFTFT